MKDLAWFEKYRPKTVEDTILPDRIKKTFLSQLKTGKFNNYIFYGRSGIGKTTVAEAMCKELGLDYLKLNAGIERNIDVIRTRVNSFGSTMSFDGENKMKVIIFDEGDKLTQEAQGALNGVIEEFAKNCYFIFTVNDKNKLIPAISSRCVLEEFYIKPEEKRDMIKQMVIRCISILTKENIEFDKKAIIALVVKFFPDFRQIIVTLDHYSNLGNIDSSVLIDTENNNFKELIEFLKDKKYLSVRNWLSENRYIDTNNLVRHLYDEASQLVEDSSIPVLVDAVNEIQRWNPQVANPEINTMQGLTQIMSGCTFK